MIFRLEAELKSCHDGASFSTVEARATMPIITHMLTLDPNGPRIPIAIRIYAPELDGLGWRCRCEIDWPDEPRVFDGRGVDAL